MNQIKILTLCVLLASATNAAQIPLPTTLDALLNDTEDFVVVGELSFGAFMYGATGDMPPASSINVSAQTDAMGNSGIRFQGGFLDTVSVGASDAVIEFTVSADSAIISDAVLGGNPDLLGGAGLVAVTETFLPQVTDASLSVFDNGTVEQLTDRIVFDTPLQTLNVQKDINLNAEAGSAGAVLSFIDQTFSIVPEPATFSAAIFGFLGLLGYRRRR